MEPLVLRNIAVGFWWTASLRKKIPKTGKNLLIISALLNILSLFLINKERNNLTVIYSLSVRYTYLRETRVQSSS